MRHRPGIHGYLEGVLRFLKLRVVEEGGFGAWAELSWNLASLPCIYAPFVKLLQALL